METYEFGTVFVFNSTVAEPSGFNSRCKRALFPTAIYSFILSLGLSVEVLCHS